MDNEKSIFIKEEQTNEMSPQPTTMFLEDPLGVYWSTDHINEDSMPNLGWDENENNNAAVDTLLHTILEAESESCPPPLLVPKKELFPDQTLGISCLTDFIKEDPELNLEADETENIFLQDPLKLEEPSFYVKQEVELKLDVDDSKQKVYASSVSVKEEMEDGLNQEVQVYPSRINVKEEMEDGVKQEFLADPLHIEDPGLHIKQDPELDLDVDESEHNAVASRSYPPNNTRLLQSNKRCEFPVEETESQGVSENELEIGSEESTHFIMFREREEEEKEGDRLSAPRLKCSLRENKCQTFICSFCLQSLTSKYRLMMHVFVHIDGVEPPEYVCKSCAEVFPSYVSLKKHLKISDTEQDSSADKEETFDCSGKSFTNLGALKDQALIHTGTVPHKCVFCGKSFSKLGSLKNHSLIHALAKPHKCDICSKSFTVLGNLKKHSLIHTGTKTHKCDICGKSFTKLSSVKKHSLIHTGIRPHKCCFCGDSFTRLDSLKTHSLIHTGKKNHKCDICGKSFTMLGSLKIHSLIHTGTKPHKCDICGKSFTLSGSLKVHSLIHTGTKPHKCDICDKSFTQLGTLKKHSLIHTGTRPHKCDICGKSFTQLGTLKNHSLTHTGTKNNKCDICGKSFTKLSSVKKHSLIHTGIRPHKCCFCGKSFTRLDSLKRHSLIHTGKKKPQV